MTIFQLIELNEDLLKKMHEFGIRTGDYKYVKMFREYQSRIGNNEKSFCVVKDLAARLNLSTRSVFKIIAFLKQDCTKDSLTL